MMKRMRVLYFINVNWGWIKQRPQFIAEYLSEYFDVTVYQRSYVSRKKQIEGLVHNEVIRSESFSLNEYYTVSFKNYPFFHKLGLHKCINRLLLKLQFQNIKKSDIIWFGSPLFYKDLHHLIPSKSIIVYDCMDDYLEFPNTNKEQWQLLYNTEKSLISRADLVVASSQYLYEKLEKRYGKMKKALVVNNAIEIPKDFNEVKLDCIKIPDLNKSLLYIGTISEWFDFSMMIKLLNKHEDLHLVLVGPVATTIPTHPRILSIGPVEHNLIFGLMRSAFALIMPFIVNELILSVDPVKLYEYIYSGKPVISVKYRETEKFKDFVQLYDSFEELDIIVSDFKKGKLKCPSLESCQKFVNCNTWKIRCDAISTKLLQLWQQNMVNDHRDSIA